MTDTLKNMKILLPMIRNLMPKVIAQDIVGVQPMGIEIPKWKSVPVYEPVPDGEDKKSGLKFLMIRRRNSLGFMDFMRGKYSIYNKE